MKKITCLAALLGSTLINTAIAAEVQFEIQHIKADTGKIYIALFAGENDYQAAKTSSALIVKADKSSQRVTFSGLSEGEYAIRYYHDQNNNGKLDTNMFGIPIEGYGFSNNAQPNFAPVAYDKAKFQLKGNSVINLSTVIY